MFCSLLVICLYSLINSFSLLKISKIKQNSNFIAKSTILNEEITQRKVPIFKGSWLPIASISSLDWKFPTSVEILGEQYVVWNSMMNGKDQKMISNDWFVMKDICSHRLAPLSQGRVDPATGCIECPYHGWQFNSTGSCTKIPQLELSKSIPTSSTINSYSVKVTGDILWSFLPIDDENTITYPFEPDHWFPVINNVSYFVVRELPYSFDYLVENFMDPAHIPWAHHSLQGTRNDSNVMNIKPLYNNETHCEVNFDQISAKKTRDGIASFISPCYYHFRTKINQTNPESDYRINLLTLVVPITEGRCRIFATLLPGQNFALNKLPRWLLDDFFNKIFESDIWVHTQEKIARGFKNEYDFDSIRKDNLSTNNNNNEMSSYLLPTSSDEGVREWRKYWKKNMYKSKYYGPLKKPLKFSYFEQYDRYNNHIKFCKKCKNSLKNTQLVKQISTILAIFGLAISKSLKVKVIISFAWLVINYITNRILKMIQGPSSTDKTSAAQF